MESATLLGVREVFILKDLQIPILLDEADNGDTIVLERGTIGWSAEGFPL
jgi:hypothetical protein